MSHHRNSLASQGFSLIEMAMVMVIIGLLVGGVLAGMSLMRAAEIRSIVQDYQRYMAAVEAFQDKYGALPGDMHNATMIWGEAHATPATCKVTVSTGVETCDGNGNGELEWNIADKNEIFRFWQHLANAGMIEGHYTGVAGPMSQMHAIPGENVPMGKVHGTGLTVLYMGYRSEPGWFPGEYGNMAAFGSNNAGNITNGYMLTPTEMLSMDQKLDDGKPGTGHVRTHTTVWYPDCATSNDATTALYDTSLDEPACALIFPEAF